MCEGDRLDASLFFLEMCVLMLKVTPSLQSTYIGKHSMNGYALDESYTRDHIK